MESLFLITYKVTIPIRHFSNLSIFKSNFFQFSLQRYRAAQVS